MKPQSVGPVALSCDFFQPPLGRHAAVGASGDARRRDQALRVQKAQAKPRRTPMKQVAHQFHSFKQRVANAMKPKHQRVDLGYRKSLKNTSAAVADLLGALHQAHGIKDQRALDKAFARIETLALPVAAHHETSFIEVLKARFGVHLAHLSKSELKALRTRLGDFHAVGTSDNVLVQMKALETKVDEAIAKLDAPKPAQQQQQQPVAADDVALIETSDEAAALPKGETSPHGLGATQQKLAAAIEQISDSVKDEAPDPAWNELTRQAMRMAYERVDGANTGHADTMNRILNAAIGTDMKGTPYLLESDGQADRRLASATELVDAVQPTAAQHRGLARLANTDLWKTVSMDKTLASSAHTPIRSPEGSPLQLDSPLTQDSCRIHRGSDGQLHVTLERVLSNVARAQNMDTQETVSLDADSSQVRLSIGLSIQTDGSIAVSRPLACEQHIVPRGDAQ